MIRRPFKEAPSPLRELTLLYVVTFLGDFGFRALHLPGNRLTGGMWGAATFLVGLTLAFNFNGAAFFASQWNARLTWLGTDRSASITAKPLFARLFGVFFVLLGIVLLAQAI
jgi:hypothetical protein